MQNDAILLVRFTPSIIQSVDLELLTVYYFVCSPGSVAWTKLQDTTLTSSEQTCRVVESIAWYNWSG